MHFYGRLFRKGFGKAHYIIYYFSSSGGVQITSVYGNGYKSGISFRIKKLTFKQFYTFYLFYFLIDPFSEDAQIPYFDGFPLLTDKQINDIEVDGGNRKWVATNNGLWLFNEDASEVLMNFTADNSPLPTNDIKQVEVDGTTGEVFVLTDFGIISFRGEATDANENKNSNVKVFPNPVRSGFDGVVAISGLVRNAPVKITDIYGNLVYETNAKGGTATWSGNRLNGKRAESGVYLVFSSTAEGEEGNVAKIVLLE